MLFDSSNVCFFFLKRIDSANDRSNFPDKYSKKKKKIVKNRRKQSKIDENIRKICIFIPNSLKKPFKMTKWTILQNIASQKKVSLSQGEFVIFLFNHLNIINFKVIIKWKPHDQLYDAFANSNKSNMIKLHGSVQIWLFEKNLISLSSYTLILHYSVC